MIAHFRKQILDEAFRHDGSVVTEFGTEDNPANPENVVKGFQAIPFNEQSLLKWLIHGLPPIVPDRLDDLDHGFQDESQDKDHR